MRTRTWCVAGALLCLAAPATSQTVLTEGDALARLAADSPRVRAIRAGVDVARAEALAAGRWPNPRASFNRESVAGVTENMVTVTQSLPITGRRTFEVSAANALATARERRADEAVRQARAEVRTAYATLVSAQTREREFSAARDRVRDLADLLARRENAGDAAGYDRLRAEREVMDLESELATARADRARAERELRSFFDVGGGAGPLVVSEPSAGAARAPLPGVEELLTKARAARGEAAALEQELASAQLAQRAADRRLIPEPEVVAGTKSSNAAGGDIGSVVSVHVSVPLFDRARPEKALARARAAEAQAQAAAFDAALAADIVGLRAIVAERREIADRYRTTATSAAQLERIARVSYDAGERGILELLDAYRGAAAARTRQAALDAAAKQAEIELEFVSGWEMP